MLAEHGLAHQRIKPHCPEENGLMERAYRTLREALEGEELTDRQQAEPVLEASDRLVQRGAIASGAGLPAAGGLLSRRSGGAHGTAARKLAAARHQRKEANLRLRQRTLPLQA